VKRKKKLNLVIFGGVFTVVAFVVHSYLAKVLEVFPNPGISCGLNYNLLLVAAFIALVTLTVLFWRRGNLCLMVILIGGLINFIDRIIFGYVRDYWSFFWFYNNLADWIIFFGVLCSTVMLWKKK